MNNSEASNCVHSAPGNSFGEILGYAVGATKVDRSAHV